MFILIVITSLAIVHIFSHDCFFYGYIDDDWKSITTYFALNDFMLSLTTFSAHNTSLRNDEPFWCPLIRKGESEVHIHSLPLTNSYPYNALSYQAIIFTTHLSFRQIDTLFEVICFVTIRLRQIETLIQVICFVTIRLRQIETLIQVIRFVTIRLR